jgi:hypothetical protein
MHYFSSSTLISKLFANPEVLTKWQLGNFSDLAAPSSLRSVRNSDLASPSSPSARFGFLE